MYKNKLKLSGEVLYPGISSRNPLSTRRGILIEVSPAHPPTTQELGRVKKKRFKNEFFSLSIYAKT